MAPLERHIPPSEITDAPKKLGRGILLWVGLALLAVGAFLLALGVVGWLGDASLTPGILAVALGWMCLTVIILRRSGGSRGRKTRKGE